MVKLSKRRVKIGVATSVAQSYWEEAEISRAHNTNKKLDLTKEQVRLLE